MADDPAPLLLRPRQEAGHVDERDERDVERVAEADEPCGLHRRVDVEHARERARLVADHADRMPTKPRETADHVLGPQLVYLQELAVVDDAPDDVVHVVRLVRIVGHETVELRLLAIARVGRLRERRRVEIVLREEREQVARVLEAGLLVGRGEVRDARLRRVSRRAAELLESNLLARHRLHHIGARDEHVRRPLHHEDEVRDRRRVHRATRAGPHHQ